MVTLTGNFKYQDGSAVSNGVLTLALSQPCTITATGQVAPLQQKVQLDANGAIPANTSVYGNDALTPSGTVYVATLYAANKNAAGTYVPSDQLSNANWSLTGTSVDVSTLTPTSPSVSYVSPVTSVALTMPGEFSVSGSPVTASGTLAVAKANQSANLVYAGPSTGAAAAPAFRALVSADLPLPGATSPGAVESKAAVAHQFLTSIGVDGSVGQAQPASTDLSDVSTLATLAGAQALSNKTLTGASSGNAVSLLSVQGQAAAIVGNGADQAVFSYTLPANVLAVGKAVRVTVQCSHSTGTASVTYRWKLGSTTIASLSSAVGGVFNNSFFFFNNGATNAQQFNLEETTIGTTVVGSGGAFTSAEDTTASKTLQFTFSVANTDQVTPLGFLVELVQ